MSQANLLRHCEAFCPWFEVESEKSSCFSFFALFEIVTLVMPESHDAEEYLELAGQSRLARERTRSNDSSER